MKIKSIFLILFLIPSLAMADYYFTVENTTMVDTYFNIFNAIASLFKNDSYIELLRLIFLLGGFFVFAGGVLSAWETNGSGKVLAPYAKYTLVGVALLTFMFSQKENMWVTTNNIPSFCSTGSHTTGTAVQMPAVLAYFFSVTNRLGTSLTYMAESAFNTPNANGTAAMSDSNGYLGSLKETLRLLSFNPNQVTFSTGLGAHMQYGHIDFLSMWQNFFAKCVYDVAQNKGITGDNVINGLVASNNIPLWLDNYMGTNPFLAESPGYPPSENLIVINGEHTTCGTYYQFLKDNVNPKLTDNYACAFPFTNAGVLELITGNSGGIVSELNGIALQSGLINALGSSKVMTSIGISGADFASGKSRAESNQENLATAQYMAQMLPYLQMTMRAVLYAFFPFVFITVLLPGGLKVLGQYAQTLIWIELWGPTAAIVNMFVNMQVKAEVATKYNEIGLTYMSSIDMLGEANTIAGVGAMLYLSIPALTWLIISGSGQMLGNLASGVSGKFSKNLESASVAQDMANIQKQQEVNARRQAEGMKALSYGEQMHYEANMKGMKEAGSMIAAMNTGLQSVANASQLSEQTNLETAMMKIKTGGGIEGVTKTESNSAAYQLAQTREKLGQMGVTNPNGTLNHEKFSDFAKTSGGQEALKAITDNKFYKDWAKQHQQDPNSRHTLANYLEYNSKIESRDKLVGIESKGDVQENTTIKEQIQGNSVPERTNIAETQKLIKNEGGEEEVVQNQSDVTSTDKSRKIQAQKEGEKLYGNIHEMIKAGNIDGAMEYIKTQVGANNLNEFGVDNLIGAKTRKEFVDNYTQLKTTTPVNDQSTQQAAEITEKAMEKLESDKTKFEQILSNTPEQANKEISKLMENGYSKAEATTLVAMGLMNKGINNKDINESAYKEMNKKIDAEYEERMQYKKNGGFDKDIALAEKERDKALENEKKFRDAGNDKVADAYKLSAENQSNKIGVMRGLTSDEYIKQKREDDKNNLKQIFLNNGAASADKTGYLKFNDTLKDLQSLEKGNNNYHQKINEITGNLSGMNTKEVVGVDGMRKQVVTNILSEKVTDTSVADRGTAKRSISVNEMGYHLQKNMSEDSRENYGAAVSGVDAVLKVASVAFVGGKVIQGGVNAGKGTINASKQVIQSHKAKELANLNKNRGGGINSGSNIGGNSTKPNTPSNNGGIIPKKNNYGSFTTN